MCYFSVPQIWEEMHYKINTHYLVKKLQIQQSLRKVRLQSLQTLQMTFFSLPVQFLEASLMLKLSFSVLLVQTLFFNHRSLDLRLSDLSKSEPTVSPDKPMGQLWAASSSVFEAQSLTNSEKSSGIV